MSALILNAKSTAFLLIDLQKGILARQLAPHSAADVLARSNALVKQFREVGGLVVRIKVSWTKDHGDAPANNVDEPTLRPPGGFPPEWAEFPDDPVALGDLVIVKRQWGAFYGTELDMQLRRRGIKTVVLCGIATNFGVESTARSAWEHYYDVVIAEDACTSMSAEMHEFSIRKIMPRLGRVRQTSEIVLE